MRQQEVGVQRERRRMTMGQRKEPVHPGLSAWTLFLPSGMQLTLGFQATPVVCHCLTYFCKVSSSPENAFAQAIAAGLLDVSLSRSVALPTIRTYVSLNCLVTLSAQN